MPKRKFKKVKKPSQGIAIAALLINILLLPGLGSIIGGRTNHGVIQLVLFIVGIPLSLVWIGIPLLVIGWVWAVITGVDIVRKSY